MQNEGSLCITGAQKVAVVPSSLYDFSSIPGHNEICLI